MFTDNIELLSTVHAMQAKSKLCVDQLNSKIADAPNSTHIMLKKEGAVNLVFLLEMQSKFLTAVLEENQTIHDRLEKIIEKLS